MAMIRILHIVETIGSGGVERRRLLLCKNLDPQKYTQLVVCTQAYGTFKEEFLKYGVEVIEVGVLKSPLDFRIHKKVQRIIQQFQPDIIHGAVFEGVTLAAINGFICRVPYRIIEETSAPSNRSKKANILMQLFAFLSHRIVAVSPATFGYLTQQLKLPQRKCMLITNGVAMPTFLSNEQKLHLRHQLNLTSEDFVIGSVGRMHDDSVKRFSDCIRVTALLKAQGIPVKLLLVGGGREKKGYEALVQDLNLVNEVIFTDYQNDVQPYYEIMDLFLLLSSTESFGLVLAEAMLHKLPVVATNVGGIPYLVDDNHTGILIKNYSLETIASQIITLQANAITRKEMGEKGFQKAMANYTETAYSQSVERLYLSLMETLS